MLKWIAAAILALTPVIAQAGRNGVPYVAPTGSVSIPVSSQSNGAISANNWTGFTSPAGTVFTASTWGATNTKYLQASDFHLMMAQTTAAPRDVEVTSYVRDGIFFLRQFNGTAIYCRHNADGGTTGFFELGVAVGVQDGSAINSAGALYGTYYALYQTLDMATSAPGYDRNATSGATLTCGVSGLTIYAKFNGVTFKSVLSNYAVAPGKVALWANNGIGFRDVTVTYLATAALASMPSVSRFNPIDWGLKQGQTTGSITSGTPTLTLAASIGVAVGDSIIVATGGESGAGARGTVGVGGNSPVKSYANAAAMNADTGQPNGSSAWTQDNGQAFVTTGGVWARGFTYYSSFTSPRALLANVTGVSNGGLTLTLDTNATTTATNATVYVNNFSAVNAVLNPAAALPALPYQTMDLPAGTYAFGAPMGSSFTPPMALTSKTGWRILGQGSSNTTLMSPAGATSMGFTISQSTFTEVAYVGILGNNRAIGFGVDWAGNFYQLAGPRGIEFISDADNSVAHDFTATDIFYSCVSSSFGINIVAHDFACTQTFVPSGAGGSPDGDIEPWHIEWANSTGGGAHDFTFSAPVTTTAAEMFQSNGVSFQRGTINNGVFSCNTCGGGFLLEDMTFILSPLSGVGAWFQNVGVILDFNGNIGGNPRLGEGGTVNRPTVIQQGYYDNTNAVLVTSAVNPNNSNVKFTGTYPATGGKGCIQKPSWFSGTNAFFGMGIRSDATGTVVSGIRVIGNADYAASHSDVYAEAGSLTSTNNVMDSSVLGAGSITQTGTQSNATWNAANPGHTGC